jgi:hypothetical protein
MDYILTRIHPRDKARGQERRNHSNFINMVNAAKLTFRLRISITKPPESSDQQSMQSCNTISTLNLIGKICHTHEAKSFGQRKCNSR